MAKVTTYDLLSPILPTDILYAVSDPGGTPVSKKVTVAELFTSPVFVTPTLGVAGATSINKVAITAPATSATLTIVNLKTLTVSNTLALAGTDATVMTFPTTSASIARIDAGQTFQGNQDFNGSINVSGTGNISLPNAQVIFWSTRTRLRSGADGSLSVTPSSDTAPGTVILGISTTVVGTSGTGVLVILNGTAPSSSPTDVCQLYARDSAAADSNLVTRNEAGKVEQITGRATRVTSQFDSTNETPANITGLTFNVLASGTYSFEAVLFTTSNVAGGVKIEISGTATATAIIAEILIINAGTITQGRVTALDSAVGVTAVTVALVKITGTITVNAGGTLTVQASRNAATGTTSVLIGSYFRLIPNP